MMATQHAADSFGSVEAQLQDILRPIQPSQKFVQTVRQRIHFSPRVGLVDKSPEVRRFLVILGGVLSASLLLITAVRAIFYLVNRSRG